MDKQGAEQERCPYVLAGYESHAGHPCVVPVAPVYETTSTGMKFRIAYHEGRHRCEHGKDGGWRKVGSHLA